MPDPDAAWERLSSSLMLCFVFSRVMLAPLTFVSIRAIDFSTAPRDARFVGGYTTGDLASSASSSMKTSSNLFLLCATEAALVYMGSSAIADIASVRSYCEALFSKVIV